MEETQQTLFMEAAREEPFALPLQRIAPAYVWRSAVDEWETIYRRLMARGVPRCRLESMTNAEFCTSDTRRRIGGLFPRFQQKGGAK